jgi:predicted nucleotidyltransferase
MDDFSAFTDGERALLEALERRGVPFMMVGLGAAVLQGANSATRDIDLWFKDLTDERIAEAAREANAIWVSGALGMRPPQFGGDVVGDRLDVVTHMHGLGSFTDELANAHLIDVSGIRLYVLDLKRILASKRATGRPKDLAAIPALEEAIAATNAGGRRWCSSQALCVAPT